MGNLAMAGDPVIGGRRTLLTAEIAEEGRGASPPKTEDTGNPG